MKVDMRLALKDVPGSLVNAIEPISGHGGNIVSVLHSRGSRDLVDVKINFRVRDQSSLDLIKRELVRVGVRIREIRLEGRRYYAKKSLVFVLVGHVIDRDMQDTLDRLNSIGTVSDIDVKMSDPRDKSSVLIKADVDENRHRRFIKALARLCSEKELVLIDSI